MILTIDIGNTTVSLCGLEREGNDFSVCFQTKISSVRENSSETYQRCIRQRFAQFGINPEIFEGIVLSSVVPCLVSPVTKAVQILTGKSVYNIGECHDTGLSFAISCPEKLGFDRIADAAWAAYYYSLPVVTVDMGTATTFNVIDEGNVFRGGIIAPGLETGFEALCSKAAQLSNIQLCTPAHIIGENTEDCMRSGVVAGAAAMVDGMIQRIEKELGKDVSVVMTGGLSNLVESLCEHPHVCDTNLLAKGLAFLYEHNK